ncbi:TetR/AcrR family transcriptional regulator [Embleya sp. NPDC059237]|uniref:TetR/AcrR family transcriptional regulator n=1 Tax=Embleya sp. NPDC059237 TaxID=3346784 RepID=UPI00369C390A
MCNDGVPSTIALPITQRGPRSSPRRIFSRQTWWYGSPRRRPAAEETVDAVPALDRLIAVAIEIADREGRAALTMRRLAGELGVGAMSLYRHVPDKEELTRLMADVAFGAEPLPEPGPEGWRAKLELCARVQRRAYRRHPWLTTTMLDSLVRPPAVPSGMLHVDWQLRALAGLGLSPRTALQTVIALDGYVGGIAASNAFEVEAEHVTGISGARRLAASLELMTEIFASGRLDTLAAAIPEDATTLADLDELFEFGLRTHLDGIAALIAAAAR